MAEARKIRLLIVDDHPVVRDGLAAILSCQREMEVVGSVGDGQSAVNQFKKLKPDVTLMDLRMPQMEGLDAIRLIRQIDRKARILVLTTYADDEDIFRAIRAGALGYLLKDSPREVLVEGIRKVFEHKTVIPPEIAAKLVAHATRPSLSDRERDVLELMADGKTNKEIARTLNISEVTVKTHVNHLLNKLGATNRTDAVRVALETGLVRTNAG